MAASKLNGKYHWDKARGVAKRPWRLYGTGPTGTHGSLPWRSFSDEIRAHNAAAVDVMWGDYRAIEVYDARNGLESGTHSLRADGQTFFSVPKDGRIAKLLKAKGVTRE